MDQPLLRQSSYKHPCYTRRSHRCPFCFVLAGCWLYECPQTLHRIRYGTIIRDQSFQGDPTLHISSYRISLLTHSPYAVCLTLFSYSHMTAGLN